MYTIAFKNIKNLLQQVDTSPSLLPELNIWLARFTEHDSNNHGYNLSVADLFSLAKLLFITHFNQAYIYRLLTVLEPDTSFRAMLKSSQFYTGC